MATPKKSKAKLSKNNTTGYAGVTVSKPNGEPDGKFIAQYKGKKLGYFKNAIDAAKAYDAAASAAEGEKANLNFPG